MDEIDIDPQGYTGTYKLVGGRLALDFINTMSWPYEERRHDWLSTGENLVKWCRAVGITLPGASDEDLPRIHRLRHDLDRVARPVIEDALPTEEAVAALNRHLDWAFRHRRLSETTLEWVWTSQRDVLDYMAPVVIDAAEIVARGHHERLGSCPSCAWLFEDHSRNGQRRWCDMADCGSRAKSRRYYHRRLG
jgi:predicted RNA-binding Zn ribbon-like protein